MKAALSLAFLSTLALTSQAHAELYTCEFPQLQLRFEFIPKNDRKAKVYSDEEPEARATMSQVKSDSKKLTLSLSDKFRFDLEVDRQASWTDEASKRNFPFKAALKSADGEDAIPGGCQSVGLESKPDVGVMRFASSRGRDGTVALGAWTGEGAENRGFQIEENVLLAPGTAFASLARGEKSPLQCTLAAGTILVPSMSRTANFYSLNLATRTLATADDAKAGIKAGDPLTVLGSAGTDLCYVDKGDEVVVTACPQTALNSESIPAQSITKESGAPLGEYVLVPCKEGYGTFVSTAVLAKQKSVKKLFFGF